jgi:hypothetical protein
MCTFRLNSSLPSTPEAMPRRSTFDGHSAIMRVLGFTPLPLEECVAVAVDLRCNKRLVAYTTPHRNGRAAAER